MSGQAYYAKQSEARGLKTSADIEAVLGEKAPVYDRLLPGWLPADRSAAIYEAACGPGILLRWLRSRGYTNVKASDASPPEVEMARAEGFEVKLANSVSDLAELPEGSLSAILAIDFIEHLPKDDFLEFLRVSQRALKAGGSLILRAPNGDSPVVGRNLYNDVTHVWAYTSTATNALAKISGFRETQFVDDTLISIQNQRWLRVPFMHLAQAAMRLVIRLATKENLACLGSSVYVRMVN